MKLENFFKKYNKIALGFSGGVDSTYLLYVAKKCGADIKAYYLKTPFQPQFELDDAMKAAKEIGSEVTVIEYDILSDYNVCSNPANRCYYCKTKLFGTICDMAENDGYNIVIDGTNASDDADDRPGMKALEEISVLSPLRLCGLTKDKIRKKSKEVGLFTWDKPAYACLATRIPTNEKITADKLEKIEKSENILFELGFSDFRVRYFHDAARLQFISVDMEKAFKIKKVILDKLEPYFKDVFLDLRGR